MVRDCPRIKFLLVGDGPCRHRFESRVRELGLAGHFVFTGLVAPDCVPRLVGIMDLLVHLSPREGLPRALPQALAAAKPVIAYDRDGACEACLDGKTGFLLPWADVPGLTRRLLELATDAPLREHLGRQGQQFVRERFGVQQMVDELHELYQRLASKTRLLGGREPAAEAPSPSGNPGTELRARKEAPDHRSE